MKPAISRNFFLPRMSESEAAGKLIKMPGMVEAAAITPVQSVGVPRLNEKGFKTGLLDIVELRIAKKPMMQSIQNMLPLKFFLFGDTSYPHFSIIRIKYIKRDFSSVSTFQGC